MTGATPRTKEKTDVRPSSQDAVQRWLDVFIPMTGLPKARQQDIRAELEDHLRARTNDLMITGLSEPEAVQQAVNELGETAHLARQFRTALKPKRNTLMHAALIAIAGSALTLGIVNTASNSQPAGGGRHASVQQTAAAPRSADLSSAVPVDQYDFARGGTIDPRTATFEDLIERVRKNFDKPIVVHWDRLEENGFGKRSELDIDSDPIPTHEALRIVIQRSAVSSFPRIAVLELDDVLEISMQEDFDRRSVSIRAHDISKLVRYYVGEEPQVPGGMRQSRGRSTERRLAEEAGGEILQSAMMLASRDAWTDFGGDLASAQVIAGSLIIEAPARIHTEVGDVISMMEEEVERFQRAQAEDEERANRAREETIAELAAQLDRLRDEILVLSTRRNELSHESQVSRQLQQTLYNDWVKLNPANQRPEADADAFAALEARMEELRDQYQAASFEDNRLEYEIEDKRAYRLTIRNRLVELEHGPAAVEAAEAQRRFNETQRRIQQNRAVGGGTRGGARN